MEDCIALLEAGLIAESSNYALMTTGVRAVYDTCVEDTGPNKRVLIFSSKSALHRGNGFLDKLKEPVPYETLSNSKNTASPNSAPTEGNSRIWTPSYSLHVRKRTDFVSGDAAKYDQLISISSATATRENLADGVFISAVNNKALVEQTRSATRMDMRAKLSSVCDLTSLVYIIGLFHLIDDIKELQVHEKVLSTSEIIIDTVARLIAASCPRNGEKVGAGLAPVHWSLSSKQQDVKPRMRRATIRSEALTGIVAFLVTVGTIDQSKTMGQHGHLPIP